MLRGCVVLDKQKVALSIINKYLEQTTIDFFAAIEPLKECFSKGDNNLRHFYDNEWLACEFERLLPISDVELDVIIKFFNTSILFEQQRHECEQRIIKWLIKWIMEGRSSWIASEEYDNDFLIFHKSCDLGFHDGIVDALVKAGMEKTRAEEGMEYNAELWFEKYINMAFDNRYDPIYMINNPYYEQANPVHRETWLRLRIYAYYQYHKDIIDKVGNITDDMKMSLEKVRELNKYLEEENRKREKFLECIHNKVWENLRYADDPSIEEKRRLLDSKQ